MSSIFTSEILEQYNIIGIFSLKNLKNNREYIKDIKDIKEDYRGKGFEILSSKKEISNQLKKTKFCDIKLKYGNCNRKVCNFAHSIDEIVFPKCAFGENCRKKILCQFLHPLENEEEYKRRINFKFY